VKNITSLEKRRRENWVLAIIFIVTLIAALVFMIAPVKFFVGGGIPVNIDSLTLRLGTICLFFLFLFYIVQNEQSSRKHARMLIEDRVSIGVIDRRLSELSELGKISKAVTSVMEMGQLYGIIMDSALKLTGADHFSLLLEEEGYLRIKTSKGLNDDIARAAKVRIGEGIAGWVAEKGEPVILNGPVRNGRFKSMVSSEKKILSSISVPVKLRGKVFGVICVSNIYREYNFAENDLRLLSIFADQVAIALENNDLFLKLSESLESLKKGQEQVVQSAKLSALGEMISGITHELNNRLSPIIAYSELLRDRTNGDDPDRYIGNIYRSAIGARKLLRSLSSFTKEKAAAMEYVNLNEIMEKVIEMMAYQLEVSDVRVVKELDPALPMTMADPFQIEEVFFNIVKNALLSIGPSRGELRLKSDTRAGRIIFRLTDNGVGIPEEALPMIFDPFFTTREGDEGTGLGLSICYGILKVHGGDISVSSREGEGTTVSIELPVTEEVNGARLALKKSGEVQGSASLRILVLDDEEVIRQLVVDILSKQNDVEAVGTVAAALKKIEESDFDLIIADFRMPRTDGIQFYRTVSERKPSLKNRILFITGDASNWRIRDFLKQTGNRCISKPFSVHELNEACGLLVGTSSSTTS